ncbi:MAG TPA: phosphoribosylamine--glycine ligase [Nitrospiria bacterium]|nr:phosphoribosylamine--glycine ligase [Nitrospiria bacterium]
MKVLVIGGGGREHALVWKLSQSPKVKEIYCAPGNAGIANLAECIEIRPDNLTGFLNFSKSHKIDLTVVGPELPLALGVVDEFQRAGLRIFGPTKAAAMIESSKIYAKQFMKTYHIPTAKAHSFDSIEKALGYARQQELPLVIKADGLAAGKGVMIAHTLAQAEESIDQMMHSRVFGSAGEKIVIEAFLTGEEATILAFTDGRGVSLLPASQDHKRLGDGDQGANTGGMGAYAPAPVVTPEIQGQVLRHIVKPTLHGLAEEGCPYKGVLYFGLMICKEGPRVLEFNCRFGDPEAQVVLPLLDSDLVDILEAVIDERLDQVTIRLKALAAICVVMASSGYPEESPQGFPVKGLKLAQKLKDVLLFHAGTALRNDRVVTHGGRVLGVTALGADLRSARDIVYKAIGKIYFEGMQYRKDIAARALIH